MIFIGSTTNLLVYDCTNNSDVFDKEVNDGLLCICPSPPNNCIGADEPLVLIGGNSSITGFDMYGDEKYWNVSKDKISAI
jgi:Bardet-Biedl syndrome 2 protein